MLSVVGFVIHLLLLPSAQSNTQNLTIHGLCFLWQLQRYQMAYSEKNMVSHWMDIAADHCHWKDQIRFHLRRKTRPWSSSIRPTHLILVTDNLLNLSLDFQTAPWSRCVWFWIRITGILFLQSTSTSAFIKPELCFNTCGLEPINYQNTCAWLLFCCWDLLDNFHTFLSRGDIIYPECPQPIHRPIILPR